MCVCASHASLPSPTPKKPSQKQTLKLISHLICISSPPSLRHYDSQTSSYIHTERALDGASKFGYILTRDCHFSHQNFFCFLPHVIVMCLNTTEFFFLHSDEGRKPFLRLIKKKYLHGFFASQTGKGHARISEHEGERERDYIGSNV